MITAERSLPNKIMLPIFWQHQKAYFFCLEYVAGKSVLELGSGSGFGSRLLAAKAKAVLAVDSDCRALTQAQKKFHHPNLSFVCKDIMSFKSDSKFDVIIALQTLEHLPDPSLFLKKANILLEDRGVLIISTPNTLNSSPYPNPYHLREYTPSELKDLISESFPHFRLYGLHGDRSFRLYNKKRLRTASLLLRLDFLSLRRLLPRRLLQIAFDFLTLVNRTLVSLFTKPYLFSLDNFTINRRTKDAIDLIVVARK